MRKKVKQLNIEVVEADNVQEEEDNVELKPGRIKAYDYRAWTSSEYETDSDAEREELERQRKIQEANAEKDRGNTHFKKGSYEDAVTCYTRGIDADPSNAILPANRAMALIKLKRFSEAEKDCSASIHLDFTYVKAYARRGTARIELGKLEDARKDFQQVLNIEPSNKQAVAEIKRIDANLKRMEKEKTEAAEKERIKLIEEEGVVRPIYKPLHLRSKKPLRRLAIEEIGVTAQAEDDKGDEDGVKIQPLPSSLPQRDFLSLKWNRKMKK
ncbi:putative RNA polymerase II-associated protein 3 [Apostichopus japonicus]|uniref:Putative RNA polymerase II-associated protein 3 n=1 Tax=Stichopus japonicus TaxID=307972 RepID=A0A2G8K7I2_STIJA|nr:putative RNA polymerase II-associated protein 3 [Apostichopus japonicus]